VIARKYNVTIVTMSIIVRELDNSILTPAFVTDKTNND